MVLLYNYSGDFAHCQSHRGFFNNTSLIKIRNSDGELRGYI